MVITPTFAGLNPRVFQYRYFSEKCHYAGGALQLAVLPRRSVVTRRVLHGDAACIGDRLRIAPTMSGAGCPISVSIVLLRLRLARPSNTNRHHHGTATFPPFFL